MGVEHLWKTMRKNIFTRVLGYDTTPRESAMAFKLGYYNIIIRPLRKLLERSSIVYNNDQEYLMLNEAYISAMKEWLKAEPNLETFTRINIEKVIKGEKKLVIEYESAIRLLKNRRENSITNNSLAERLQGIKGPSLIYQLSNAPYHIVESIIDKYILSDHDMRERDREKLETIIRNYFTSMIFVSTIRPENDDWEEGSSLPNNNDDN